MGGDGVIRLGATFDKTNVDAGLGSTQEMFKEALASITTTIVEARGKSRAAWKGLSDDVKATAENVSAESLKVAEAVKAQTVAYSDLRRASILAKDSSQDELATTAILAAAQQKAAAAAAELSEAKKVEAEAVEAANLRMGLSENMLVAQFQLAGREIAASFAETKERMVLGANGGEFSIREFAAGIASFGEIVAGIVAAGMVIHFADETARAVEELGHLSVESGIAIANLSGLKEIVQEMGTEWDPVANGVVRLQRAIVQATVYGMPDYVRAFQDIGVSMKDLNGKKPEEQLNIVAAALQKTADTGRVADASITLFSRGGMKAIPVFKEYGGTLAQAMEETGKLTGVTESANNAAREWTRTTQRLSMEWHAALIPTIEVLEKTVVALDLVFKGAATIIVDTLEGIGTAITSLGTGFLGLGTLMKDALTGNFGAIKRDFSDLGKAMYEPFQAVGAAFEEDWARLGRLATWQPPKIEQFEVKPSAAPTGNQGGIKADEEQLYQMKIDHDVQIDEEIKFWKAKLAAATKGSAEYAAVLAKLAPLMQKERHGGERRPRLGIAVSEDALNELKLSHEMTLEEEIAFWEKRLAAAKKGSAEYRAIVAKLAPLEQREMKKPQETAQLASPDLGNAGLIPQSELDRSVKANEDAVKAEIDAARAGAEEKMRIAAEDYQDTERNSAFAVAMGQITAQQRIEILRRAAVQEQQIRQQQLRFISMLDMNDARRYQADLLQQEQATRQFARLITQLNQQTALDSQKVWTQAWGKMTADLNTAMSQWVAYGHGFEQSMAKSMGGITANFTQNVMKMMEQEIRAAIQHKALAKDQILTDAKTAAGNSYKWASDWGGPIAGAVAAAAAFAGVLAFDSFADGGVVRGGGGMAVPILAHAGERVLSQSQTENFHKLVNQSSSTSSANTTHLHLQQNVNAYDRSGMRSTLRAHADDLLDIVQGGISSGRLKPA